MQAVYIEHSSVSLATLIFLDFRPTTLRHRLLPVLPSVCLFILIAFCDFRFQALFHLFSQVLPFRLARLS